METTSYNTRRKRKMSEPVPKSRVDWKRTKITSAALISASSEESCTSEEEEEGREDGSSSGEGEPERPQPSAPNADEDYINKPRHKSRSAVITSSDSSSDSDVPIGNTKIRRHCNIDDEDDRDDDHNEADEPRTQDKKRHRMEKLTQLAERRRSRGRTTSRGSIQISSGEEGSPRHLQLSSESSDSDNMSDFIVQDEEEGGEAADESARHQELFLKHNISQFACNDLHSHLQKVVKAFLINIVDKSFLKTLYEKIRQKKYARDMLKSLNYLDERILAPRLEKLLTTCRWNKAYKERVSCYPYLSVQTTAPSDDLHCDACKLRRISRFRVTLSGQAYDKKTLEDDDFMPNDKQVMRVGNTCASRTETLHPLQHYKYLLYQRCVPFIDEDAEAPAKELVDAALAKMEEENFISKEADLLEAFLSDADYFQEEMLD